MRWLALAPLFVAGCAVIVRPHGTVYRFGWDEDEVHYVVLREYYGCPDDDAYWLLRMARYHALHPADIFFVAHVARAASVDVRVAFRLWYFDFGRDHHRVVVHYRIDPDLFFVSIPERLHCPPPYGRAYGYWRNRTHTSVRLDADEYRALVLMRVGVDYCGLGPADFFAHVQRAGNPHRVIVVERDRCGRGGRDCRGRALGHQIRRPWQMEGQERERWRRNCETEMARHGDGDAGDHGQPGREEGPPHRMGPPEEKKGPPEEKKAPSDDRQGPPEKRDEKDPPGKKGRGKK